MLACFLCTSELPNREFKSSSGLSEHLSDRSVQFKLLMPASMGSSTPVSSNAHILEVLDRSNYKDWRSRLKTYLLVEDHWEIVEGSTIAPKPEEDEANYKAWTKKNVKALYAIQNSCGRELFSFIREMETAKGAWDALELECNRSTQTVHVDIANTATTSLGSNALNLEVLNRNNYENWRTRVKTYLVSEDLWEVVESNTEPPNLEEQYKAWRRKDARALYTIQISCGQEMFSLIREVETAKVAWEAFEQEFRVLQGYDENNADHVHRFKSFVQYVINGYWDFAKKVLGDVDVRSILARRVDLRGHVKGATALIIAAMEGHVHIVKELVPLMTKEYLKVKTTDGYTALHQAAHVANLLIVKQLPVLWMGDVKDNQGNTALHVAVEEGKVEVVKGLVKLMREEDSKIKNNAGYTALHLAVNKGNMPMVNALLKCGKGENDIGEEDFGRYTPFTSHVFDGDWDKAKECLRELDDPCNAIIARDPRGDWKGTALHVAAREGHVEIIKELVLLLKKREEELKLKTGEDFVAFGSALDFNQGDVMKRVKYMVGRYEKTLASILEIQNAEGDTALHCACAADAYAVEIVKQLVPLTRQESLEVRNNKGSIALHTAVRKGNVQVVRELAPLMRWEGLLAKDDTGSNALHIAVEEGHMDIATRLISLISVSYYPCIREITKNDVWVVKDGRGDNALHIAIIKGHKDIATQLISKMDLTALAERDNRGFPVLHIAIMKGHTDIARELISGKRKDKDYLETQDASQSNALHIAIKKGQMDIARELISMMRPEALVAKDNKGFTALGRAILKYNDEEVIELARYMAKKNDKVFGIPEGPDNVIPVNLALASYKWDAAVYLYSVTPRRFYDGPESPNGTAFICCCLNSSKSFGTALDLLLRQPVLALTVYEDRSGKTTPMLKLAALSYAFLSGKQPTPWQRLVYKYIDIEDVGVSVPSILIDVAGQSEDAHENNDNKRGFMSSGINLYIRLAKKLQKLCGIHYIYEMKLTHTRVLEILRVMAHATKDCSSTPDQLDMIKKSIFSAVELGHIEFVTTICEANPELFNHLNSPGKKGLFHLAIENRQKEIYSLIYKLEENLRERIKTSSVNMDNSTLLHHAANLCKPRRTKHVRDACLQMQNELQWFKEVESFVPPEWCEFRERSNKMTASELFIKNHEKLMENAENSIKGTATSCTVAGALIVTMMFAAVITVPGGNNGNTGLPFFLNHKVFKVFIVSDTISLVSSISSVISFLGILTSRYAAGDYRKALPTQMMIGLITFCVSIISMMIVFSCVLILMLNGEAWIVNLSIFFSSIPVILFVRSLFALLIKTFISTYGHGIVDKKKK